MKFLKIKHIERREGSFVPSLEKIVGKENISTLICRDVIINIDHIICVRQKEYNSDVHIYSEIVMLDNPFQETIFVVEMSIEQFHKYVNEFDNENYNQSILQHM